MTMKSTRRERAWAPQAGSVANGTFGLVLLIVVGFLVLLPVGFVIYGALTSGPPGTNEAQFTFENVARVFGSPEFLRPALNSLIIGLVAGFTSLVVGTGLAWLVAKTGIQRPAIWEYLVVIPNYVSPLMLSLAFTAVAAPRVGFVNILLPGDGIDIYSFGGMVWVMTVSFSGYVFLYMLAPMRSLNAELEEAAVVLGSSRFQTIRRIVLPLLGPAMVASFVMVVTLAAENFAVPSLLGNRIGYDTLTTAIYYNVAFEPTNPNLAAAQGLMLLILTMAGIAIYQRMIKLSAKYVTIGGRGSTSQVFALRKGRWVPPVIIALWLLIGVAIPLGGMVFASFLKFISPKITLDQLSLANYQQVFAGNGVTAITNSVLLAVFAGLIVAVLGALISWVVQRTRAPGRGALDYLTSATIAIPRHDPRARHALGLRPDPRRDLGLGVHTAHRICHPLHLARRPDREPEPAADLPDARGVRAGARRGTMATTADDHAPTHARRHDVGLGPRVHPRHQRGERDRPALQPALADDRHGGMERGAAHRRPARLRLRLDPDGDRRHHPHPRLPVHPSGWTGRARASQQEGASAWLKDWSFADSSRSSAAIGS